MRLGTVEGSVGLGEKQNSRFCGGLLVVGLVEVFRWRLINGTGQRQLESKELKAELTEKRLKVTGVGIRATGGATA